MKYPKLDEKEKQELKDIIKNNSNNSNSNQEIKRV